MSSMRTLSDDPVHRANLAKLADWLEQNAPLLASVDDPDMLGNDVGYSPPEGYIGWFDMRTYSDIDADDSCGSSGCAIGWATRAVEPRQVILVQPDYFEPWQGYANRLFGTNDEAPGVGNFMFGVNWRDTENNPKMTAERIRYVLDHGKAPEEWGPQWQNGCRA